MVEISDIKNRGSLQAWLDGQPQRFSVVIAHRAAMRVLPDYWHWAQTSEDAHKGGLTALPVLWPESDFGGYCFLSNPRNQG